MGRSGFLIWLYSGWLSSFHMSKLHHCKSVLEGVLFTSGFLLQSLFSIYDPTWISSLNTLHRSVSPDPIPSINNFSPILLFRIKLFHINLYKETRSWGTKTTIEGGPYPFCRKCILKINDESPSFSLPVVRKERRRRKVHGHWVLLVIHFHRIKPHRTRLGKVTVPVTDLT